MPDLHGFSEDGVKRIVETVRYVEGLQRNRGPGYRSPRPSQPMYLCKPQSSIAKGASGKVDVYSGGNSKTVGSESALTGPVTLDAYARMNIGVGSLWAIVAFIDGYWEIIAAECQGDVVSGLTASTTAGTSSSFSTRAVAVYNGLDGQSYQQAGNSFAADVASALVTANDELVIANHNVVAGNPSLPGN